MNQRIATDRSDSDSALFNSLLLKGELITKITIAGLVAAIREDPDKHKYIHAYNLVRANGIGDWSKTLDDLLRGPSSQLLPLGARNILIDLTKNEAVGSWQYDAIKLLNDCLRCIDEEERQLSGKLQGRQWFRDFAVLRNRTRGHGATRPSTLSDACPSLEQSLHLIEANLSIFDQPWAYIRQNLTGKYRVTNWGKTSDTFRELTRREDRRFSNGVYIDLGDLHEVELIESDADASDIWVINGKFNENTHELLSYFTDDTRKRESGAYLRPIQSLPPSETEGLGELTSVGKTFTNLQPVPSGYVPRLDLEAALSEQLCITDRHSVITLTGAGGIGKTSLALAVINDLMKQGSCPYEVAVWFSARDVDLLPSGPKTVRPQGVSVRDFATEYVSLRGESREQKAEVFLANQMGIDSDFKGLFVFDNFETTSNPAELFQWIDTYIRPPNKVLITSRQRSFTGDYTVQVHGMSEDECHRLIDSVAESRGIRRILTDHYKTQVIDESRGHPYVIKLILGELARDKSQQKVERIIAGHDRVLEALFERSYTRLGVGAQRAFLTLCSWKSSVPRIALEAVLIRPQNEMMNVDSAIDELLQMSFIEEIVPESSESDIWLSVPLAARTFGAKKLGVSPWRVPIETDSEILQLFGAVNQRNAFQRVEPRIRRMFRDAARGIERKRTKLKDIIPILEYVSGEFSVGWIFMSELLEEFGDKGDRERIRDCLMKYVETPNSQMYPVSDVWRRIAKLYEEDEDLYLALHALVQAGRQPETPVEELSNTANQINTMLREKDKSDLDRDLKTTLIKDVVNAMEDRIDSLEADDCSRLAWLYMNIGDEYNALRIANLGLEREYDNQHCERLIERLKGNGRW